MSLTDSVAVREAPLELYLLHNDAQQDNEHENGAGEAIDRPLALARMLLAVEADGGVGRPLTLAPTFFTRVLAAYPPLTPVLLAANLPIADLGRHTITVLSVAHIDAKHCTVDQNLRLRRHRIRGRRCELLLGIHHHCRRHGGHYGRLAHRRCLDHILWLMVEMLLIGAHIEHDRLYVLRSC